MSGHVEITVDRDYVTGALQVAISVVDEMGYGDGYRIAGPKYTGNGETLLTKRLDERDAAEIRAYLDRVPERGSGRV